MFSVPGLTRILRFSFNNRLKWFSRIFIILRALVKLEEAVGGCEQVLFLTGAEGLLHGDAGVLQEAVEVRLIPDTREIAVRTKTHGLRRL